MFTWVAALEAVAEKFLCTTPHDDFYKEHENVVNFIDFSNNQKSYKISDWRKLSIKFISIFALYLKQAYTEHPSHCLGRHIVFCSHLHRDAQTAYEKFAKNINIKSILTLWFLTIVTILNLFIYCIYLHFCSIIQTSSSAL